MTHIREAWYDPPVRACSVPAPTLSARPAGRLELDLDIDRALDDLHRAFPGICIWHGEFSGSFWALLPDRLAEARTAADLAGQLHAALPRPEPRRPCPSTRRADGTWTSADGIRTSKKSATRRPVRRGGRVRHVVRWLLTTCLRLTPSGPLP